jgi:hypothetical protein
MPVKNRQLIPVYFTSQYLLEPVKQRYSIEFVNLLAAGRTTASDWGRSMNLAACVARARSAPKLRYIIGCAPVIFGVPAVSTK